MISYQSARRGPLFAGLGATDYARTSQVIRTPVYCQGTRLLVKEHRDARCRTQT